MLLFMNKQKKSLIIHPFLLSIFPIIALFSSNVRELSFQEMFLPMVLILSFTTGIWILLRYILKNGRKSAFIISLLLVLFFSYGYLYNLIDNVTIDGFDIGRSRYLLVPYLVTLVVGIYYFVRTNRKLNNVTTITNSITISLILIVSINIGTFYMMNDDNFYKDESLQNSFPDIEDAQMGFVKLDNNNLPDVYYIVLDGYAGINTLKEFLGFDNSLIKNKFLEVFPKDKSDISLNNWNKFETNNPDIFIGMYKFWVRKIK